MKAIHFSFLKEHLNFWQATFMDGDILNIACWVNMFFLNKRKYD